MKTDSLGIPRFTNKDLIDMIYTGHSDKVHVVLCDADNDVDKFNVEDSLEQGTAIFFPSYMKHGVVPVTKGTRYSLVCWTHGPNFK